MLATAFLAFSLFFMPILANYSLMTLQNAISPYFFLKANKTCFISSFAILNDFFLFGWLFFADLHLSYLILAYFL
jgi:hypothetical protein